MWKKINFFALGLLILLLLSSQVKAQEPTYKQVKVKPLVKTETLNYTRTSEDIPAFIVWDITSPITIIGASVYVETDHDIFDNPLDFQDGAASVDAALSQDTQFSSSGVITRTATTDWYKNGLSGNHASQVIVMFPQGYGISKVQGEKIYVNMAYANTHKTQGIMYATVKVFVYYIDG